jgi:hypothetical protein
MANTTEPFGTAIIAYRNGQYREAMEMLSQLTDSDSIQWLSRFFLGMSYEKCGRLNEAHRLFKRISIECPNADLREKAEDSVPVIEEEMRRRFKIDPARISQQIRLALRAST